MVRPRVTLTLSCLQGLVTLERGAHGVAADREQVESVAALGVGHRHALDAALFRLQRDGDARKRGAVLVGGDEAGRGCRWSPVPKPGPPASRSRAGRSRAQPVEVFLSVLSLPSSLLPATASRVVQDAGLREKRLWWTVCPSHSPRPPRKRPSRPCGVVTGVGPAGQLSKWRASKRRRLSVLDSAVTRVLPILYEWRGRCDGPLGAPPSIVLDQLRFKFAHRRSLGFGPTAAGSRDGTTIVGRSTRSDNDATT